jgi:NAD(P)-dependent dehydrogenase (short-subunit alcohol dehydrogenase family)
MRDKWTTTNIPDLTSRVAIVTGANSGTGFETARAFAGKDAQTILACRNPEKGQAAVEQIRHEFPNAPVDLMQLDLASLASVHKFAETFKSRFERLDILVNNAGILWAPYGKTEDGFERHLGTNFLGHFALTGLLIDLIQKTPGSRVVTVSSVEHYLAAIDFDNFMYANGEGFSRLKAYRRSKLSNLIFAYELQRRLDAENSSTISLAAHPGVTGTNMLNSVAYLWFLKPTIPLAKRIFQSPAKGALPLIRAAVDPNAEGGQFYGPDGLLQFGGDPVVVSSSKASLDRENGRMLWKTAQELTGISYL